METVRLLTEVEVAYLAGFRRVRDFRRALRTGDFPQPDVQLPDGPRWSAALLRRWLQGESETRHPKPRTIEEQEQEILRRIRANGR